MYKKKVACPQIHKSQYFHKNQNKHQKNQLLRYLLKIFSVKYLGVVWNRADDRIAAYTQFNLNVFYWLVRIQSEIPSDILVQLLLSANKMRNLSQN